MNELTWTTFAGNQTASRWALTYTECISAARPHTVATGANDSGGGHRPDVVFEKVMDVHYLYAPVPSPTYGLLE